MIWRPCKGRLLKRVCRGSWPSGLQLEDRIGAGKLCLVGQCVEESPRRPLHLRVCQAWIGFLENAGPAPTDAKGIAAGAVPDRRLESQIDPNHQAELAR